MVECQFQECVKILLDHSAQADVVDVNSSTSLHLAAANGDVDIAVLLLEREAKVDAQDKVINLVPNTFLIDNFKIVPYRTLLQNLFHPPCMHSGAYVKLKCKISVTFSIGYKILEGSLRILRRSLKILEDRYFRTLVRN